MREASLVPRVVNTSMTASKLSRVAGGLEIFVAPLYYFVSAEFVVPVKGDIVTGDT